jgi:AraC family transcriptional regulator
MRFAMGNAVLAAGQFYGEVAVRRAVGGLLLSETRYPADASFPRHSHDRAYFSVLIGGAHVEQVAHEELDYRPFVATFHPSGEEHAGVVRGGSRMFVLELDPEWLSRVAADEAIPADGLTLQGSAPVQLTARLYHEFLREDGGSALDIEELACEMVAEAARSRTVESVPPRWLARVEDLLHAETDGRLDLAHIAGEAGVHPMHVTRVFRRHHGVSMGAFLRRLKVETACAWLARPGSSLADVAARLGFTDQAHFTRTFKAATGLTPGRFRDAALGRARGSRASGVQDAGAADG